MVRLLNVVAVEGGLNTRVLYLEGETIFGSTKQKLDLPLGDESDSHCNDRVNYSVPKLGKGMSPAVRIFNSQQVLRLLLTCEGILGVSKHKNSTITLRKWQRK